MAHQGSDLREICGNTDISKASTGISSEMKLVQGKESNYYLIGPGQQLISRGFSGIDIVKVTWLGKNND